MQLLRLQSLVGIQIQDPENNLSITTQVLLLLNSAPSKKQSLKGFQIMVLIWKKRIKLLKF